MKFTVKRKEWWRGDEGTHSRLLRRDGQRCCLGFLAQACGYSDHEMLDVGYLDNLSQTDLLPREFYCALTQESDHYSTTIVHRAATWINDDPGISDKVREQKLTELFARYDIQVVFEG